MRRFTTYFVSLRRSAFRECEKHANQRRIVTVLRQTVCRGRIAQSPATPVPAELNALLRSLLALAFTGRL